MTSAADVVEQQLEKRFMAGLRARYEDEGFTFTTGPTGGMLPDFFGSYVPDALAQKPGHNVAIEVKHRPGPSTSRAFKDIRQLFAGHPDWQLQVVFMGIDPLDSTTVTAAEPAAVRRLIGEVRGLIALGYPRSAFVMAWSLLEAALRSRDAQTTGRPLGPGTVVQALAMNGYIEPELEQPLRQMIDLRNRIVHGDLTAEPAVADVELVVSAIEQTLSADGNSGN